ncbi:MAG: ATP-dependent zinc metalloprotease FtsH [Oscillospiraceae bacterium]|nr:ATP-dependent zinc metalloprotease FtsH [Oscillospiraceae bacterium]
MENKKDLRNTIVTLIAILGIIALVYFFFRSKTPAAQKYSDILKYFDPTTTQSREITEYELSLQTAVLKINLKDKDGVKQEAIEYKVPNLDLFVHDVEKLRDKIDSVDPNHPLKSVPFNYIRPRDTSAWVSWAPTILMIVAMVILWIYFMRKMNNTMGENSKQISFGKAKIKKVDDEKRKTTFEDVAGADEEKEELQEIVEFLKNPKKYSDLGAHIPKGVLLVGPPGTGKTLLARAVAGEAGVPFFSISGSDFVEMFVGVGASRVRDLFDQAKKNYPCIIFIDEIDAVGRHRGAGLGGGHDEREQTLNQLLVEMDGFGANEGVIMIAATNRPDILDPALTRPGRFDRQIMVGYPDIKGREEILKVHAKGKPLAPDVDLSTIAKSTAGFTGADLENLLNEAALLSARRNLRSVTMSEIEEATIKVIAGTEKRTKVISDKDKKITAYHEAGHAVATYFCETQDPVHQISIIPRGMAGGYTMSLPQEDRSHRLKSSMLEDIVTLLGGRVAEALVLGDISTGASSDLERASKIARDMVTKYGMSEKLGPITFGSSENNEIFLGRDMGHIKDFSDKVANDIDNEVSEIIMSSYKTTNKILSENISKLHEVAQYLIGNEKMNGEDFAKMMASPVNL